MYERIRQLLGHSFVYGLGSLVARVLAVLLLPLYTRYLDRADYGHIEVLIALSAVLTALILWAGFTAARFITHDAFEGRPWALTGLNIAHELVTVIIMGLIIGVWPPAGTV